MAKMKWVSIVIIALVVVFVLSLVWENFKPVDDSEIPYDATPIPEDVVVPPTLPAVKQVNLFASTDGTTPKNIVLAGGQSIKLTFQARDDGPSGAGYTLRIPVFDVEVTATPGNRGQVVFKPAFYGSFRYYVDGAGDGGGMIIVQENE